MPLLIWASSRTQLRIKDPFLESNFPFFSQLLSNLQTGNIKFFRLMIILLYVFCPTSAITISFTFSLELIFSDNIHTFALLFVFSFCPWPHFPYVLPPTFALALALYFALKYKGKIEGKGKGKRWGQNMGEMGARAKMRAKPQTNRMPKSDFPKR